MLSFKQFLSEEVVVVPAPRVRLPLLKDGPHWTDRGRNMTLSALNDTDRGIKRLVAIENGMIVGAVSYQPYKKRWVIDRIGSLKKGVGTLLMTRVISLAKEASAERIELFATSTSDTFYNGLGFKNISSNKPSSDIPKVLLLQPEFSK